MLPWDLTISKHHLGTIHFCIHSKHLYQIQVHVSHKQLYLFVVLKRECGVWQGLRNRWFHLQNKIKIKWGDSKKEISFDVHHFYEQSEIKTKPIMAHGGKNPNPEKRN